VTQQQVIVMATGTSHRIRPATGARYLTAAAALLVAGASAAGLWVAGVYTDGVAVEAMFRGYDLVTLLVIAPLLVLTLRKPSSPAEPRTPPSGPVIPRKHARRLAPLTRPVAWRCSRRLGRSAR
jgi:hypothetical protein